MGEQRAVRERIDTNKSNIISMAIDDHLPITETIVYLHSFQADKLIYVHNYAFCYNKCKLGATLESALTVENGEENA